MLLVAAGFAVDAVGFVPVLAAFGGLTLLALALVPTLPRLRSTG